MLGAMEVDLASGTNTFSSSDILAVKEAGPYSQMFEFERNFDRWAVEAWVSHNWAWLCLVIGLSYVLLVFLGKAAMDCRQGFQLRFPLALWSASLALFSLVGFVRTLPELLENLRKGGVEAAVCQPSLNNKVMAFWTWMFTMSKIAELGDTAFIILRKQNLIFLHWYHHLTVLISVFANFSESYSRWSTVINFFVHSLMYSYYSLKALRVRVPQMVRLAITTSQLAQFGILTIVNCLVAYFLYKGKACESSPYNLVWSFFIVANYLYLFARFFYQSYYIGKKIDDSEVVKMKIK